jgi:hypothetical protein
MNKILNQQHTSYHSDKTESKIGKTTLESVAVINLQNGATWLHLSNRVIITKQALDCTYNVILRDSHETVVAVEKQYV